MESSAYSSPRNDVFPAGLRVLVVDDDPTWLKILEKMLKKCSYEVITCGLAKEALNLIRERKDGFDIVISDVNMPDMDGFKLLEHVGLEMDLPVIMMSVDGETSRVMKGVQHGACDYLLKPIRMKELRNIWQHVLRKRIHEVRDIEIHEEGFEEILPLSANDMNSGKKRKEFENKHDGREYNEPSSAKKTRVVWTIDLHQKFVKAVNQIGLEKVGPKKILDLMNVPWLTRENIASHLQKYRLYLSRLHGNRSTTEHNGNRDFSSKTMHNIDFQIQEDDMKCIVPKGVEEPKKELSFTPSFGQCDFRQPFEPIGFNLLSIPTVQTSIEFECPQLGSCVKSKPSSISREIEGGDKLLHHKISTCDLFSILSSQGLKTHEESVQQVVDSETSVNGFGFWDENPPQRCFLQSDFQPIESLDYTDPKVIAEVPDYLYEYPLDSMEYSVIDHGVFIM